MEGWIKLHRQLLENPVVMKDAEHLAIWIYLLLHASHSEREVLFGGKKIIIKEGQLITGRKIISQELGINESKTYRVLNELKSEHQIEQQTSNRNSLITVLNWNLYQNTEQQIEQQVNNKRTTSEQQVNTNKNVKNDNNINNNIYTCKFEEFWKLYPRKKDKGNAFKKFNARLKAGYSEDELIQAAKNYADECHKNTTEQKYIKLASTFLSDATPFIDYLDANYKPEVKQRYKRPRNAKPIIESNYNHDDLEKQAREARDRKIKEMKKNMEKENQDEHN